MSNGDKELLAGNRDDTFWPFVRFFLLSEDKQQGKGMDFICHRDSIQVENMLSWEGVH